MEPWNLVAAHLGCWWFSSVRMGPTEIGPVDFYVWAVPSCDQPDFSPTETFRSHLFAFRLQHLVLVIAISHRCRNLLIKVLTWQLNSVYKPTLVRPVWPATSLRKDIKAYLWKQLTQARSWTIRSHFEILPELRRPWRVLGDGPIPKQPKPIDKPS